MKLNEKFKELRLKNNYSQKKMAQLLNVSLSTIQKIEYGDIKLKNEMIIKLCEIFNLSLEDFKDILDKEKEKELKKISEINNTFPDFPFITYNVFIELLKNLNFEILDYLEKTELTYYDKISDTPIITIKIKESIVVLNYHQFISLKKMITDNNRSIIENFLVFIDTEKAK